MVEKPVGTIDAKLNPDSKKIETKINEAGVKKAVEQLKGSYGDTQKITDDIVKKIQSYNQKNSPLLNDAIEWKLSLDAAIDGKTEELQIKIGGLGFLNQTQNTLSKRPDASKDAVASQLHLQQQTAEAERRAQSQQLPRTAQDDLRVPFHLPIQKNK